MPGALPDDKAGQENALIQRGGLAQRGRAGLGGETLARVEALLEAGQLASGPDRQRVALARAAGDGQMGQEFRRRAFSSK
ncbi:MAG: hypothetical protein IT318_03010 [Anaerolineales bacterium]|nr:hypothetical protein [Anaerolineales bacterium]